MLYAFEDEKSSIRLVTKYLTPEGAQGITERGVSESHMNMLFLTDPRGTLGPLHYTTVHVSNER